MLDRHTIYFGSTVSIIIGRRDWLAFHSNWAITGPCRTWASWPATQLATDHPLRQIDTWAWLNVFCTTSNFSSRDTKVSYHSTGYSVLKMEIQPTKPQRNHLMYLVPYAYICICLEYILYCTVPPCCFSHHEGTSTSQPKFVPRHLSATVSP